MLPITFVAIPHWKPEIPDENFLDVFSSEFSARCERLVKEVAAPLKDNPFLIGCSLTDCPLFTEEDCRERPDIIEGGRGENRILAGLDAFVIPDRTPRDNRLMSGR
jgi:hypothetical protein